MWGEAVSSGLVFAGIKIGLDLKQWDRPLKTMRPPGYLRLFPNNIF